MKHLETLSPEQRKEAFLSTLDEVQGELTQKGIDYRIIGSLASHAHLFPDTPTTVKPLDYNRKGAVTPDQRVPDIDLIVPRSDLPEARRIREHFLETPFPVKLGLANPTTDIDYRPDEDESFLTHKSVTIPVDNDLLRPEDGVSLEGVPIKTVPLDTLIHTYGTFGGTVREKDLPIIKALMRKSNAPSDPRINAFHTFQKERRKVSPIEHRFSLATEAFSSKAPRWLRNELMRAALIAADLTGRR